MCERRFETLIKRNDLVKTFPGVTIFGYRFHLGQTWWRKVRYYKIF